MSPQQTVTLETLERSTAESPPKKSGFAQLLLMGTNNEWKQIISFISVVCWWAILFMGKNKASAPWLSHHITSTLHHLRLSLPSHIFLLLTSRCIPIPSCFAPHQIFQARNHFLPKFILPTLLPAYFVLSSPRYPGPLTSFIPTWKCRS